VPGSQGYVIVYEDYALSTRERLQIIMNREAEMSLPCSILFCSS